MLKFLRSKPVSIEDIKNEKCDINVYRSKTKIAIVDDKDFEHEEAIKRVGFTQIRHFKDLENVADIKEYDIIVYDISGVGKNVDKNLAGGFLVIETRKFYPEKYIIIFTGSTIGLHDVIHASDATVEKDASMHTWIKVLDNAAQLMQDPANFWNRTREVLIKKGISTNDILRLEECYIKSVQKKNPEIVKNFLHGNENLLTASKILGAFVGGLI